MTLKVGDRVRPAARVVEDKRQQAIKYTRGSRERRIYDDAHTRELDRRGTVTADLTKNPSDPMPTYALRVQWDDGTTSDCLSYRVTRADEDIRTT